MSDLAFAALADPTRRRILEGLAEQPRPVQAIAAEFDVSRPAISKHLRVLAEAGLVTSRRAGRLNLYEVEPEAFGEVRVWLDRFWSGRLAMLKRLAEGDA